MRLIERRMAATRLDQGKGVDAPQRSPRRSDASRRLPRSASALAPDRQRGFARFIDRGGDHGADGGLRRGWIDDDRPAAAPSPSRWCA
jgi:hypothetical protein